MSSLVTFNGQNYIIPATGEVGWGNNVSNYLIAIAAGCLQKTGGAFTLSAETDFGASFGLKSLYYKSRAANVASTGVVRLANADSGIVWRNVANSSDLALTVNASNQLTFNGVPIESDVLTSAHILVGNASNIATDVPMSGDVNIDNTGNTTIQPGVVTGTKIASNTITNSNINAAAGIVYSKLSLTNSILDADINSAAGIVYSKLSLTNGIVNADVNTAAAIAYSKLNLALSIVNGDISTSAAIAYSKLNLTGSIVNADISASAAIVYSKLNLSGSIVNADISNTAAITYSKLNLTSSIVNADINNVAAIAYSKLAALTTGRALQSNISTGLIEVSSVTNTELGYVSGVISSIQTQLNSKATDSLVVHLANAETITGTKSFTAGIGVVMVQQSALEFSDSSGTKGITFAAPNAFTTSFNYLLPPTAPTLSSSIMLSNSSGNMGWSTTSTNLQAGTLALGGTLDASSVLTLTSTTAGLLPPRMTTTQRNAISTPTDGLVVYDTSLGQLFLRAGGAWTPLSVGGGSGTVASGSQYNLAFYAGAGTTTTVSGNTGIVTNSSNFLGVGLTPQVALDVEKGTNVAGGAFMSVARTKATSADVTDQPGVILGYNNGGTEAVIAAATQAAGTGLGFWTFNGSSWGERVTIDKTGHALFSDGTLSLPGIAFISDTDAGFFRIGADEIGVGLNGTQVLDITTGWLGILDGTISRPGLLFQSDPGTGFYRIGAGNVGLSSAGTKIIDANSSGVAIIGTNTNNNAAAGFVGEVISSASATGTNFASTGNYGDLTSISLTAGDWLVTAQVDVDLLNATTLVGVGISTTSGNNTTGLVRGNNYANQSFTSQSKASLVVSNYHVQLSSTTTHYLKAGSSGSGNFNIGYYRLSAVRIR